MPIYSSYLCAALGRESPLVPIRETDDVQFQHGSNSFGEPPELESAWIEVKRSKKPRTQRSKHAPKYRNSDQVIHGTKARHTTPPVVSLPTRSKSAIKKNEKAKQSLVTLPQANDILDIIIRNAVVDSISSLQVVGALPSVANPHDVLRNDMGM
jgi:hypothetical protein